MSRHPLIGLSAVALAVAAWAVLFVAPASAQTGDDGCTQAAPCPLVVTVDSAGFVEPGFQVTSGDWFTLTVQNGDAVAHTVRLTGFSVVVTVEPDSEGVSAAFQAPAAGTYAMTDTPSGDQVPLEVLDVDVVAADQLASEQPGKGKGIPGLEAPVLALAVAGLVVLSRRP